MCVFKTASCFATDSRVSLVGGERQVRQTGPGGAMAMASANGLVGTGFASLYRLQANEVFFFKRPKM